jgi:Ca2+-binding RTX toxin-like protein
MELPMTLTILTNHLVGAGVQFTYAASGDELFVAQGVVLASTTGNPLAGINNADVSLTLAGTMVSPAMFSFSGQGADVVITGTGSFTSTQSAAYNAGFFFSSTDASFVNHGSVHVSDGISVLMRASLGFAANYGEIIGASPIFVYSADDTKVVNGGTVTATRHGDAEMVDRYNNGIFVDSSLNSVVINLASGVVTASGETGAAVAFNATSGGGRLANHGHLESLSSYGVRLGSVTAGQEMIRVVNNGYIGGEAGSYLGSVNADRLVNRGVLDGDVLMGGGDDIFIGSLGRLDGILDTGAGNDTVKGNAGQAETMIGGAGARDTLDFRGGAAVIVALDGSFANAGAAVNDSYSGFEDVFGSAFNDRITGSTAANWLQGAVGVDTLSGGGGADTLVGGQGADVLTGGAANDVFLFNALTQLGDRITDFTNVSGNNDILHISAAGFGGGLVAGVLAVELYRARADNLAQDADDRFIFRTTDKTLWFDADGSGAGAAVMVADLQDTATFSRGDILLI